MKCPIASELTTVSIARRAAPLAHHGRPMVVLRGRREGFVLRHELRHRSPRGLLRRHRLVRRQLGVDMLQNAEENAAHRYVPSSPRPGVGNVERSRRRGWRLPRDVEDLAVPSSRDHEESCLVSGTRLPALRMPQGSRRWGSCRTRYSSGWVSSTARACRWQPLAVEVRMTFPTAIRIRSATSLGPSRWCLARAWTSNPDFLSAFSQSMFRYHSLGTVTRCESSTTHIPKNRQDPRQVSRSLSV